MPKSISYEQYNKLKDWYAEQIKAKDKIIEQLEKEKQVLIGTAIKQSAKTKEWQEIADKLSKNPGPSSGRK
ncbi:MAG: hypothetical protein ABIF10_01390 [Candidatus Woesearchaeota archaeon]